MRIVFSYTFVLPSESCILSLLVLYNQSSFSFGSKLLYFVVILVNHCSYFHILVAVIFTWNIGNAIYQKGYEDRDNEADNDNNEDGDNHHDDSRWTFNCNTLVPFQWKFRKGYVLWVGCLENREEVENGDGSNESQATL